MKESLIYLALIAVIISLGVWYFDRQVVLTKRCHDLNGWYFRGHCFKDGKEIL